MYSDKYGPVNQFYNVIAYQSGEHDNGYIHLIGLCGMPLMICTLGYNFNYISTAM